MRFMGYFSATLFLLSGCPKKAPQAPLEGWNQQEGWTGQCFHPKAFAMLGRGELYDARQKTMESMMSQWRGEREDGISFKSDNVTDLETTMLGNMDLVETIATQNLKQCVDHFSGAASRDAWENWFNGINGTLTAGDCRSAPMTYALFDYLDIGQTWQIPCDVCEGDVVRIKGSSIDFYKTSDSGPWINVAGDVEGTDSLPDDIPCNLEGCFNGTLIMRFTDYSGTENIYPVGVETEFRVPSHGKIEVQINDTSYYDNKFKQEGSMIHHTSIEYNGEN